MACLISKRGKYYRKLRLDLWGYYAMYYDERIERRRRLDHTVLYWARVRKYRRLFAKYMRGEYVFRLWNRPRFLRKKRFKENYIKPRYLRSFYMVIKKKNYIKYVKLAIKGKMVRGFVSTYLGYLEGRLMIIIYRLNIVNNIFMIKSLINLGIFYINLKKKTHINTRMYLGDYLHVNNKWKSVIRKDMFLRIKNEIMNRNINNFYSNFMQMYFFFFRVYNIKDIHYPIRIDLYRAIDFIGPLR